MRILVLGGGAQGRVVATDLARTLPGDRVTVADLRDPKLPALPNLAWVEADCSGPTATARLMRDHDFAVGALPARLGYGAMRAAIEAGRDLVDVSFCAEDALALEADARAARVAILPDCGLAPGLSNLTVGEMLSRHGTPDEIMIMVGGVSQDPARPYGYVVTWSVEDLLEEYTRPARIVSGGRRATVPVFSGYERVPVDGVGEMEAFYSDGLRTLLDTVPGVREMGEKTLRWPGHAEAVRPLVAAGRLVEELRARCTEPEPSDLAALRIALRWGGRERLVTLVERADPVARMSAMARTTACTCSVVAQLVASGAAIERGIQPLERVGRDLGAAAFIHERLAERGVRLVEREVVA